MYDVVVAGGGPAGLSAAMTAAEGGLRVLLLHKDLEFGRPVRTSGGSWEDHLRQLQIPSNLYQRISKLIVEVGDENLEYSGFSDSPVVLDITGLYQYLADLAARCSAELVSGARVETVRRTSNGFSIEYSMKSGANRDVFARTVVDATGSSRSVLASLDLRHPPKRFGVGAEVEFRRPPEIDLQTAVLAVGRPSLLGGYGWVFPSSYGSVRVGVGLIRPDTPLAPQRCLDSFLSDKGLAPSSVDQLERHSGFIASDGLQAIVAAPGVYAVGDTASHAVATVGEGIRYAIDVGRRLGQALARSLPEERHDQEVSALDRDWSARFRSQFAKAQLLNIAMGRFKATDWAALIPILRSLSADEVSWLLKAEHGSRLAVTALQRAPFSTLSVARRILFALLSTDRGTPNGNRHT